LEKKAFNLVPWFDHFRMRQEATVLLHDLAVDIPRVDRRVRELSGGQRQALAISKAVREKSRLLIMDEPTAALGVAQTRKVLDLVHSLKTRNLAIIYIGGASLAGGRGTFFGGVVGAAIMAREFLSRGIHVICEKVFTKVLQEAHELRKLASESGRLLCLTHCYTGYPMVRQAKALVKAGAIGRIRLIEAELSAGDPGVVAEPKDPSKRHWRFRKSSMGEGAILGEVGSHPFNMVCFVSGLKVVRLSARMSTVAAKREVYDNAYLSLDFENDVQGRLWASYVAAGNDHGLWFRIFGEEGSLTWYQEQPDALWLKPIGGPAVRYAPGFDSLAPESLQASRFRAGHPEGYALAFANLYSEFAQAIIAEKLSQPSAPFLNCLPNSDDGVHVMEMIEAAGRSNDRDGAWMQLGT
jgi:predicted dehydrogenase